MLSLSVQLQTIRATNHPAPDYLCQLRPQSSSSRQNLSSSDPPQTKFVMKNSGKWLELTQNQLSRKFVDRAGPPRAWFRLAVSIVCSQVVGGSSHDIGTRRQESRCLAGYTSIIIVITVTTVIIIIPTFFAIISPQLLVIVFDGRGISHEEQWSQAAGELLAYGRRADMVQKYHCY